MFYKRTEYFRYTFGEPVSAKFRIRKVDDVGKSSGQGECSIMDLSLKGAKFFTNFDIPTASNRVNLTIIFLIHTHTVEAHGGIVWKKAYRNGYLYGLRFDEDHARERLIASELKLLGKEELAKKKKRL